MESMEEMTAVLEALQDIGTIYFWLGGKYNSSSGKYYWVGSREDADVTATRRNNWNLVLNRSKKKIISCPSYFIVRSLCEEY